MCRSVVHLGVCLKGIVKSNAKGVIFVFFIFDCFLVFSLQAAFRLSLTHIPNFPPSSRHFAYFILALHIYIEIYIFINNLLYSISVLNCSVWVSSLPGGFASKTHLHILFFFF